MDILSTLAHVTAWQAAREERLSLGLVPTMGALHAGHLSLLARAQAENGLAAASLFVNPAQFGPAEDLAAYPRDLARDLNLLEEAGCDLVFVPAAETIYPPGFDTWVLPGAVADGLEGDERPGHFRGVATVVLKLFNILRPDRAYFGQKDAQQLAVVRAMVRDLNLAPTIVACPTVREPDGLAMSSRNTYLTPDERRAATVLYRALGAGREARRAGESDPERIRAAMRRVLDAEPLAATDYVSVADPESLTELDRIAGPALLSLAVRIGRTRLIDNLLLDDRRVDDRLADDRLLDDRLADDRLADDQRVDDQLVHDQRVDPIGEER